jgi:hypothetical protein
MMKGAQANRRLRSCVLCLQLGILPSFIFPPPKSMSNFRPLFEQSAKLAFTLFRQTTVQTTPLSYLNERGIIVWTRDLETCD